MARGSGFRDITDVWALTRIKRHLLKGYFKIFASDARGPRGAKMNILGEPE